MKLYLFIYFLLIVFSSNANSIDKEKVILPFMDRPAAHRLYADELLALALEVSAEEYGPYEIIQQKEETVVGRQLIELQNVDYLSVAIAMPRKDWLDNAELVPFPIMRGLASYRMFFTQKMHLDTLAKVKTLSDLKLMTIGQGLGWSTAKILQNNGFQVIFGVKYAVLFPMLHANRFQLLMRSIYEIEPEWQRYHSDMPDLRIANDVAVYTYLPMYFFVNKNQPKLAQRLLYGLQHAYKSGQLDSLYQSYFADILKRLNKQERKVFHLINNNIDPSFFVNDKPYLLNKIIALEESKEPLL